MSQLHNTATQPITYQRVQGGLRSTALQKYFGSTSFEAERYLFNLCDQLIAGYNGGYFEYIELDNGGFYWQLSTSVEKLHLVIPFGNGFSEDITSDGASIVVTLFVLSVLCERFESNLESRYRFHDLYQYLLNFAEQHAESSAIFRAID